MQLAPTTRTALPQDWRARQTLPTDLPTASVVTRLDDVSSSYGGRVRLGERTGTQPLSLGANEEGWITRGSFDQALAAARDLSRDMVRMGGLGREAGTVAVLEGRTGWLLLRAGLPNPSIDWRERNLRIDGDALEPTVRSSYDGLQALVGQESWIDLRTTTA